MRSAATFGATWGAVWLAVTAVSAGGAIQGTVEGRGGETWSGTIRWDEDENFWDDRLDAGRPLPPEPEGEDKRRDFRFSLFGWNLAEDHDEEVNTFSVPFGHLRSIEPHGPGAAVLELKSGERLDVVRLGTDLGASVRGIVVDDPKQGSVVLHWGQIGRVRLEGRAGSGPGRDKERLYGTAVTRGGTSFTGFVRWDRDESLVGDTIDGRSEGKDLDVRCGDIAAIEPDGSSAAKLTLRDGRTLVLSGTNDVNAEMRGLEMRVAGLGRVVIGWDVLRRLDLASPPASPAYESFDGGHALRGKVRMRDGAVHEGAITWDRDEWLSFEALDGEHEDLDYSIPFELIRSIRPDGPQGSAVELWDGRKLTLTGTNDVDESNRGLEIRVGDGVVRVELRAVERVDLERAARR